MISQIHKSDQIATIKRYCNNVEDEEISAAISLFQLRSLPRILSDDSFNDSTKNFNTSNFSSSEFSSHHDLQLPINSISNNENKKSRENFKISKINKYKRVNNNFLVSKLNKYTFDYNFVDSNYVSLLLIICYIHIYIYV